MHFFKTSEESTVFSVFTGDKVRCNTDYMRNFTMCLHIHALRNYAHLYVPAASGTVWKLCICFIPKMEATCVNNLFLSKERTFFIYQLYDISAENVIIFQFAFLCCTISELRLVHCGQPLYCGIHKSDSYWRHRSTFVTLNVCVW